VTDVFEREKCNAQYRIKHKEKMQTDTHQPRKAQVSGTSADLARKESYGCRFGSSCRKVTDVFEREKRIAQEMDILPRIGQTDTQQPRNCKFSGRDADLARKKSYGGRFGSSSRKMTDIFERETRNMQKMDIPPRNWANRCSPAERCLIYYLSSSSGMQNVVLLS